MIGNSPGPPPIIRSSQSRARAGVLACVPRRLEQCLRAAASERIAIVYSLHLPEIAALLRAGDVNQVVADPTLLSPPFYVSLLGLLQEFKVRIVLWSPAADLALRDLTPLAPVTFEINLRDSEVRTWDLRECLANPERKSGRAAVVRLVAPRLRALDQAVENAVTRTLLLGETVGTVGELAAKCQLGRRTLERRLATDGICGGRPLLQLGRLVTAYDCRTLMRLSLEETAARSGYQSAGSLWENSRRFLGCAPSAFGAVLSVETLAQRVCNRLSCLAGPAAANPS